MSQVRQPKVIELTLDSGIIVQLMPLSQRHIAAAINASHERYPMPDKKAFEEVITEGAIPGGVSTPAEENPDYIALVNECYANRQNYQFSALFDMGTHFPQFDRRTEIIAFFRDELDVMRKHIELPDDPWEATWRFCILRTTDDENNVLNALMNKLPVTEAEVLDAMRIFRPKISKSPAAGLPNGYQTASGVKAEISGPGQ